jgi:hypothetical protein
MATTHDHDTPAAAALRRQKAADPRKLISNKDCILEGGWGQTTQMSKVASGILHRVNVGLRVMVTAESFWDHLIDLANAPQKRLRNPRTKFQRRRSESTPQELAGLAIGNAKRAAQAQKRREAKTSERERA